MKKHRFPWQRQFFKATPEHINKENQKLVFTPLTPSTRTLAEELLGEEEREEGEEWNLYILTLEEEE